jgi:uncharacterized protein involved in exopolysaccharide biosynthesis
MAVKEPQQLDLDKTDLLSLDYDGKVKTLQAVAQQLLDVRLEFAQVSGRYAELRATIQVLKEVKSALQSAIRAEGQ